MSLLRFNPQQQVYELVVKEEVLGWCSVELPPEERDMWFDHMLDRLLRRAT